MRTAFMRELAALAERDPRVTFVTGDLGYSVIEDFQRRFPKQFLNAGVAEQNMTGLATGMALSGRIVFTYSIGNFPTVRCLEQVRNDVCYHNANVKIVTVGGGLAYGSLGYSHHAIEDLAIMRALPNIVVLAPGDPFEAAAATRAAAEHDGPVYLRLGKAGEPAVHESEPDFEIGRAIEVRRGRDIALLSTGGMLPTAMTAAIELDATVYSFPTVKPLDVETLRKAAADASLLVTVEEHSITGGFGGAVAEALVDANERTPLLRIALPSAVTTDVGSQDYLRARFGLDAPGIIARIRTANTGIGS